MSLKLFSSALVTSKGIFNSIKSAFTSRGGDISSVRSFTSSTSSTSSSPLMEFFENGEALPIYNQERKVIYGRAWKPEELRQKSFQDLHGLWFCLLKERNLLSTQEAEARRLGQLWFGKHRELKCKSTMARIKTVLTERQAVHDKALSLTQGAGAGALTEGDLVLEGIQAAVKKRSELKRKVRKLLNYRSKRQSLFI